MCCICMLHAGAEAAVQSFLSWQWICPHSSRELTGCQNHADTCNAPASQLVSVVRLSWDWWGGSQYFVTSGRPFAGALDARKPVVVAGNSAGGNLSAVVAQKARQHGGTTADALAAQVLKP